MTLEQGSSNDKTLARLVKAVETAYNSPGKMFWRGFLWGLGKGIGSLIGWLLLLAVVIYLFKISGLDKAFKELIDALGKFSNTFNQLPKL